MDVTGTTEGLLFGEPESVQIAMGSVGWDDSDDYEFQGDTDNDGYTLVRVQLFEGRDITKPKTDRAQGYKVLCHLSSFITSTPPKDTRVYVAFPRGMENVPGAGVIIAAVQKRPKQVGNLKPGERAITGPDGSQARVVFKENGAVALVTQLGNSPDGNTVSLAISPGGLYFQSPFGTVTFDSTGFHVKTAAGPRIDMGGVTIPLVGSLPGVSDLANALTGYATITAPNVKLHGGIVWLGVPGPSQQWANALSAPSSKAAIPSAVMSGPATSATPGQNPVVRIALSS